MDVTHYEDCEQFFISVGKCYLIEALLEFFELENTADKLACLLIHKDLSMEEVKQATEMLLTSLLRSIFWAQAFSQMMMAS